MSGAWWVLATMRESVRHWAACAWYQASGKLAEVRFFALSAVLNRIATQEMRHAALLLGADLAQGFGREGLLFGPLREYSLGNEIGHGIRYGGPAEQAAALQELTLERSLYRVAAPVRTAGRAR